MKNNFQRSLALSVLIHSLWAVSLYVMKPQAKKETVTVTLDYTNPAELEKLKQQELDKNRQVVDQDDKAVNDEVPTEDYSLSKHNQKVKKQTIAKNHGAFQNINTAPSAAPSAKPQTLERKKSFEKGAGLALKNLLPKYNFNTPTGNTQNAQVAQTRDRVEGAEQSMETMLNTREFVYFTYYNRIKNQLSQYWEPLIKEKIEGIFRQGRNIASTSNKITKLIVVLNSQGVLTKVQVLGASGVMDLDDAAVEAFKKAAPFPNPPKGIVEKDGTIKIRWDFVLEA